MQHEHVHERQELIARLLGGEEICTVVNDAVACMVTKAEHSLLSNSEEAGWQRYLDAGIRVYDAKKQEWRNDT